MAIAKHLVGRVGEIDAFDRLLADLDRGKPAAIELVGEPGIGKTRVLAELGARADARAKLVLTGSASELEQDFPFGVFVDALDDYVRGLEPHRLEALGDDVRTELAVVFPSLSGFALGSEPAFQYDRYRSYRAVRKLLELLAVGTPVVLVLDDLHWADPASEELLGTLLRRPPLAPVLIALAVRPRQVSERLSSALARARPRIRNGVDPPRAHSSLSSSSCFPHSYVRPRGRARPRVAARPARSCPSETRIGGSTVMSQIDAAAASILTLRAASSADAVPLR